MKLPPLPDGRCGVLHIETKATLPAALVKHIVGISRPDTAREVDRAVYNLASNLPLARETIKDYLSTPRRGRRPKFVACFLLAGPSHYEGPHAWDWPQEDAWATRAVEFLQIVAGPRGVLATADLHRDETAPHIHSMMVPVCEDGRISWSQQQKEALVRLGLAKPGQKFKYGQPYELLQEAFYEYVSRPFGLGRGERGSKAKHQRPDRIKAQATKEGYARDRLRQQEEALEETREQMEFEADMARRKNQMVQAQTARGEELLTRQVEELREGKRTRVRVIEALDETKNGLQTECGILEAKRDELQDDVEKREGEKRSAAQLEARLEDMRQKWIAEHAAALNARKEGKAEGRKEMEQKVKHNELLTGRMAHAIVIEFDEAAKAYEQGLQAGRKDFAESLEKSIEPSLQGLFSDEVKHLLNCAKDSVLDPDKWTRPILEWFDGWYVDRKRAFDVFIGVPGAEDESAKRPPQLPGRSGRER